MSSLAGAQIDLRLHPRQSQAFTTPATELLYGGAAGGGKSHLMRTAAIAWCVAVAGLQVYIFRRTFDELYKNHMEGPGSFPDVLATWENAGYVKINYSTHTIRFWNGSVIFLCHCQHEKDVFKYKGPDFHVLMVDELTQFTDKMYRFLRSRLRLGSLNVPEKYAGMFPRIVNGTNPGDVGHNWVKATFVDAAAVGEVWKTPKDEGGMLRQFIPALLSDNPSVDAEDYEGKLSGLGDPALVRAMLSGDWDIVAGGMFDDVWSRDVHVIKPFEIPASWPVNRSFDWGSSAPFSVGWWTESDGTTAPNGITYPRGTLFRIGEWYGWNGKPNEGCKYLAANIAGGFTDKNDEYVKGILEREADMGLEGRVEPGPADDAIWDEQNGMCIARDMAEKGVYWLSSGKTPGTRKTGWEKMRQMLDASAKWPLEGPGMFIFDHCLQFIRTIPTLPRDPVKRDDVDTKAEDHIADEARYRVLQVNAGHAY